ncbi:MAG: circularly permuted type 2 ATP-grasp protein [Verrucomicrobia bacterium]|jgi:uncharacterized circularly permuted ATP-grasp superfamily protein|nr:circularly permuted type 2 ATP-grasp protein [Verrucomicrobiota bacterium]
MHLEDYETGEYYDELFAKPGEARPAARPLIDHLKRLPNEELLQRQRAAELSMMRMGITFNVYSDNQGVEKTFPFDLIPRIIPGSEWKHIEEGLKQRIYALNLFIHDLYHEQKILKSGIVPEDLLMSSKGFRPQCVGVKPPKDIWIHITGTDLVRHSDGVVYVLEDNLRCPSGVSYVLENRHLMKNLFPGVFDTGKIRSVDSYPFQLRDALDYLVQKTSNNPKCVVLTPGPFNSAYFEHSFLAQQLGAELVIGDDLVVFEDKVWMRTTQGFERVDVIYRRIDDDFLDPEAFREDSMLGVPGLMRAYKAGNIALANAPGCGVADDKVIYAYVPEIIKYYTGEEAILPNVPTYVCSDPKQLKYVLEHMPELVVKAANESGGYGLIVGPASTKQEIAAFAEKVKANPRNYIAQPTLSLSRVPTICDGKLEGRHVDLRPYVLYGENIHVLPGGLTRVALKKGSLVVNSSQGGGSKDTWVMEDQAVC